MDSFHTLFTEAYARPLFLHKEIAENDIRLGFSSFKRLCIFDINDVDHLSAMLTYANFPCTHFYDPSLRFHAYSHDIIIYPYATNRTIPDLESEVLFDLQHINKKFIRGDFAKASIVGKVEQRGTKYYIVFYINNNIIESVQQGKTDSKTHFLALLATKQKKEDLIAATNTSLQQLVVPAVDRLSTHTQEDVHLKDGVRLFNYQMADAQWMQDIEGKVDRNENTIQFKHDLTSTVFNDKFLLYKNELYPKVGTMSLDPRPQNTVHFQYMGGNLISEVGLGKCMGHDTPILMFDGTIKLVQDVVIGDRLMGDDSTERRVISLATGTDDMFDIVCDDGETSYSVNKEHILCLRIKGDSKCKMDDASNSEIVVEWISTKGVLTTKAFSYDNGISTQKKAMDDANVYVDTIEDTRECTIEVKNYIKLPDKWRMKLRGYRVRVEFAHKTHKTHDLSMQKVEGMIRKGYVPLEYKCSSGNTRLHLLLKLMELVGQYKLNGVFETKSNLPISNDIMFLCRSLGFTCKKTDVCLLMTLGDELDLSYRIDTKSLGKGRYYGFTLDGNHKYLLGDFTVTHNTMVCLHTVFKTAEETRDSYNRFVSFGDGCNYFYKRGRKKGSACKSNVEQGALYCNEHNNCMFHDKRVITYRNLDAFDMGAFICKTTGLLITNSTLVLCPNQLCDQWVKEYYDKFTNNKRVLVVATLDQFKNLSLGDILFSDLVIVSYQFLLNPQYLANTSMPLPISASLSLLNTTLDMYKWNRVVLDEAHEIQNMERGSQIKCMIMNIQSKYKWNVTGTPFANQINSYVQLLSYNTTLPWKQEVTNVMNLTLSSLIAMGFDSSLVGDTRGLFRRNTKESVSREYKGNIISEVVKLLEFTTQERNIYDSYLDGYRSKYTNFLIQLCCDSELYADTKDLVKNCKTLDEIQNALLKHNQHILEGNKKKLTELQYNINSVQIAILVTGESSLHVQLAGLKRQHTSLTNTIESIERTYNFLKSAIESLPSNTETCPICLDDIAESNLAITQCGHKFCWDCILHTHKAANKNMIKCPSCNTHVSTKDVYIYKERNESNEMVTDLARLVEEVRSTKIGNIIFFLKEHLKTGNKVILFSQWDEMLHKVGCKLHEFGLNFVYCNGSVYNRKQAIERFKNDSSVQIIMLSSRNCASGINLTNASSIILLEPVYGTHEYRKSIEEQSIGRSDRIGQNKPIDIYRFIIKDTIEEDIINQNIDDSKLKQLC